MSTRSLEHRPTGPLLVAGTAICGCIIIAIANPTEPDSILPRCPTKTLLGIDCPVCGTTRMLYSLTHGNITAALHYNAIALLATLMLTWAWINWMLTTLGYTLPRWTHWTRWRYTPHTVITILTAWFLIRLIYPPLQTP
ncbi:DUF2752 domain-containing protein [Corynebacterium felinum]|uniref:DUF2752 domain-containing protein n=1 Tax=Corynebacterium felinum TaxID=131318 RepID=A0ABU2B7F1_9CORY|nr:DUF2752 domain-containing protein [Corynebacterium felinum]MDF5820732.1 DUF2752 domain-containing protein [Corynebacterium felinum]MDR7354221.1 hypothetical protein [Corynebacterium felinum]WJY96390.1 hypothetical protein CFELI_14095 [Corynebacterium felinum]